ncbi:Leucine aminopeptidase 2, chloroplastic [Hordeum vulgare]|nr:Leucine aminopeptidase 2, chloroplastic [Hordeum vulgare]
MASGGERGRRRIRLRAGQRGESPRPPSRPRLLGLGGALKREREEVGGASWREEQADEEQQPLRHAPRYGERGADLRHHSGRVDVSGSANANSREDEPKEQLSRLLDLHEQSRVAALLPVEGIFTPSDELVQEVTAASELSGEKFWRLPMEESYWEQMKSGVADMVNTGGRQGGSITAALFLYKKCLEH